MTNGHGSTNGHCAASTTTEVNGNSANNYEKLKQELIVEFRKELQAFKADIVSCKEFFYYEVRFSTILNRKPELQMSLK